MLLAGVASYGSRLLAQEPAASKATLYIPEAHRVTERPLLHDFMDEYPFVDLITSADGLRITHIPVIVDRKTGVYGRILGHISRQNAQHQAFDGQQTGVIVFRGPHGYISPSWYGKTDVVPTWNFAVVHAKGKLSPITEKSSLRELLSKLIDKFESQQNSTYDFAKLPDTYISAMMGGIVGFEMLIESLEGKFKLGQERNETDRQGILEHLRQAKRSEPSLYDLTARMYDRSSLK